MTSRDGDFFLLLFLPELREGTDQVAERFLVAAARHRDEVARQLDRHVLPRGRLEALLAIEALEEVADIDAEHLGDGEQPAGGDAVDALLVLVDLLGGDAYLLGHPLLGDVPHDPQLAHASCHMQIDFVHLYSPKP